MQKLVFDAWTPMSFKRVMGNRTQPGHAYESPSWVGDHSRRLMAYKVLQAYMDNAAREFLATTDEEKIAEHREYGDASLIRNTILAALLGEDQDIVVPGAEDPDEAEANDDNADPDAGPKWDLQEWLKDAWALERGPLKLQETERDSVGLGDGVYSLGWSSSKERARIRVWDPGFYFPVLTDGNEDDYPDKVHIAWEVPEEDRKDKNKLEIRRITWELVELDGPVNYPWNDKPVNVTCVYSDALFRLESRGRTTVMNLDPAAAEFLTDDDGVELDQVDLGIDFVPVVHVPNTVSIKNHYGQSAVATCLQILDDLSNTDTDLQAAAATAARPVMGLKGGSLGKIAPKYNPGEVWETGEGELYVLDTSAALDALLKYIEFLLKRLSTSARTPDALLGRVDPGSVDAGIVLTLSFGPLASMIGEMRLSRAEKYPLLLKFLWRLHVAAGDPDVPAQWFPADLELGSFLPSDQAATIERVTAAVTAGVMSRFTGLLMLISAGVPIESAQEELARIKGEDFAGAVTLRDAVDSDETVLDYLGLDVPSDLAPPEPAVVPGVPDPNAPSPPPGGPPVVPPTAPPTTTPPGG